MRLALTLAAIVLGLTVVMAVTFKKDAKPNGSTAQTTEPAAKTDKDPADEPGGATPEPEDNEPATPADGPGGDGGEVPPDASNPDAPETDPEADPAETGEDPQAETDPPAAEPAAELHPKFADAGDDAQPNTPITIGGLDKDGPYMLRATISPYRAGLLEVQLAQYFEYVDQEQHYTLLTPVPSDIEDAPALGSYAARAITINGERVLLYNPDGWLGGWTVDEGTRTENSVTLRLTIKKHTGDAIEDYVTISRTYHLDEGSYTIQLDQAIENHTDEELKVQWEQFGQGDITWDRGDYLLGRSRQYVLGYFNLKHDEQRLFGISTRDSYFPRNSVVDNVADGDWDSVWPNPELDPEQKELAWLASVNRYFTVVTSTHIDPELTEPSQVPPLISAYPTITTLLDPSPEIEADADDRVVMFSLRSRTLTLAGKKTTDLSDLSLDIFAGPRKKKVFDEAPYAAMEMHSLIRYSLGGMCGFCTFQWLADGLMGLLRLFHMMLFDWGVAIILLVLIVRLCLHPITKRGQIGMMKMGKQMAAIQPDVQKLKKKYADNPQKMQQEQMKLFREKGINPAAGALGCLPMFLQMPVWIALYAMLYYAIELRHEPAFYGVFQSLNGLSWFNWHFLADLARPDHFITFFKEPKTFSLLFITFDYSGINVLPLLMAVTFYINMKFTTPPPANEQQAQQQKIMRIMPFLFPIMLYSAPSGLTLYICASTAAGIIDSYIVRKHVKELEDSGKLFEKKERKPGGLMHKIQMASERAQQQQQERAKQAGADGKNRGPQNFKKRKR